jgi:hypothetical protein
MATTCEAPAAIDFQSVALPTCTGTDWFVVFPIPNCPALFNPHAQSDPSDFSATVKKSPASAAIHFASVPTRAGTY